MKFDIAESEMCYLLGMAIIRRSQLFVKTTRAGAESGI